MRKVLLLRQWNIKAGWIFRFYVMFAPSTTRHQNMLGAVERLFQSLRAASAFSYPHCGVCCPLTCQRCCAHIHQTEHWFCLFLRFPLLPSSPARGSGLVGARMAVHLGWWGWWTPVAPGLPRFPWKFWFGLLFFHNSPLENSSSGATSPERCVRAEPRLRIILMISTSLLIFLFDVSIFDKT